MLESLLPAGMVFAAGFFPIVYMAAFMPPQVRER
jgi:hypothetical protein